MTSNASPRSLTSSAPASRVASRTSSSVTCLALLGGRHDHDALAVEQERHRARVGQRAAVAGHRGADLHRGAVPVVGEALDEHRDAGRAVALVHDRLVVRAAGPRRRAALDRAVDVVVGDRRLLGLLDGVVERRVAGRVAAAHPGGDLDVLDQLGEHLAALGVDDRLLVLGGRPFGVAGHAVPLLLRLAVGAVDRRCLHQVDEQLVDPGVAAHLGVERRRQQRTLPDRDDPTRGRSAGHARQHLDPRPDLLDPGRADEHAVHRPVDPVHERGRPRTSRPGARTRCAAR